MAAGGAAPPPEAVRRKGVSGAVTVLLAIVMLVAGVGIGYVLFRPVSHDLVVGTNVPFPPFEDFNGSSGNFEGFDIDLAQLIANETGRNLVIRQFASFTALLGAVGQGAVDFGVSAVTMSGSSG